MERRRILRPVLRRPALLLLLRPGCGSLALLARRAKVLLRGHGIRILVELSLGIETRAAKRGRVLKRLIAKGTGPKVLLAAKVIILTEGLLTVELLTVELLAVELLAVELLAEGLGAEILLPAEVLLTIEGLLIAEHLLAAEVLLAAEIVLSAAGAA
jgi:hypothetical protein